MRKIDLTGYRTGKLTVIREIPERSKGGKILWLCKCECGEEAAVGRNELIRGQQSCGCQSARMTLGIRSTIHGHARVKKKTSEYLSWNDMKTRCGNKNSQDYANYGGRGIKVCDRWLNSFENFLADLGLKPTKKHSLDRINVNGNYEPGNVRWSTQKAQCRNKRNNKWIEYNGNSMLISDYKNKRAMPAFKVNNNPIIHEVQRMIALN